MPWRRFLNEIAGAGYERLELGPYGYLPTDPVNLNRELADRGLKVTAGMVIGVLEDPAAWPDLEKQTLAVGELLAGVRAGFMVVIDGSYSDEHTGERIAPPTLNGAGWKHLVDTTHRIADLAKSQFGMKLVFHPHADTHVQHEDQIEQFLDDTDPGRVSLVLDVGHHAYAGGEPVSFMRRHHERIPYLHLKSVDFDLQKEVAAKGASFSEAVGMGVFCEPSKGTVDFNALASLLQEIDFDGYAIVEQDMYPADFDKPLPAARRTLAYLREIGIA
jgi:inosose dehydratase